MIGPPPKPIPRTPPEELTFLDERVDLFGPVPVGATPIKGKKGKPGRGKNAYPAPPGSGPEGMTCRQCAYAVRTSSTGNPNNLFSKCLKNRARWTSGYGTDIVLRSPACRLFEPEDHEPKPSPHGYGERTAN
jgi:hypothetical protein